MIMPNVSDRAITIKTIHPTHTVYVKYIKISSLLEL